MWRARVLTIFPDMFPGPLGVSLTGQALSRGLWSLQAIDIRSFAEDKHASVDDVPFGGGPGMVMRPDVIGRAVEAARSGVEDLPLVYLTPRGAPLKQEMVRRLADGPGLIALCGRFEGIDQRVMDVFPGEEISLGDFVLSGGELPAMTLIDACVRLLPGVIGAEASLEEESFETGLLEYPHYTRPREWRGQAVPDVLLSGHHENVRAWRHAQAEEITRQRRPDLWERYGHGNI
ncbi:MAG: tRNA (guanosine(37)-N1)-methyltransferase TrmD [Rhodospirillales bacterium]|nr:tRNA (guanosine(37)-N1)-methyltransferase TrmD [Rhodospirillales bacterium]